MITFSKTDIGYRLAYDAHRGTSMVPEKRADGVLKEYEAHMQAVVTEFERWATDANRAEMTADLAAYKTRYVTLLRAYLASRSSIVSSMIAGASNFPARRMEKRNQWADNHSQRLLEFSEKRLEQLRRKYDPRKIASAPISSDDPDAVERLQVKIAEAKHLQELMKAANRVVRRKLGDEEKVAGLMALGLSEVVARGLLVPDYAGRVGFPGYELTNRNANIRRMEGRVDDLQRRAQDTTAEFEFGDVLVVDNVEDNRVQVIFPDKPPADVRARLKSHGFRWAPSAGAWQRQRSAMALQIAKQVAAVENSRDD